MQLRVARHTERLDELVGFYPDGIGLTEIGGFRGHRGYDGVFLAVPGTNAHLELTAGGGHRPPEPHPASLLVFYLGDDEAVRAVAARLGTEPVAPATRTGPSTGRRSRTRTASASCSSPSAGSNSNGGCRLTAIRPGASAEPRRCRRRDCVAGSPPRPLMRSSGHRAEPRALETDPARWDSRRCFHAVQVRRPRLLTGGSYDAWFPSTRAWAGAGAFSDGPRRGVSLDFYTSILGGEVVLEENPATVKVANSWIIMNPGGGPTPDKPDVTLTPPETGDPVSSFINGRMADIAAIYAAAVTRR